LFDEFGVFALDDFEGADSAAYVDSDPLGVCRGYLELGLTDGFLSCGDGELNEAAHLLYVFAIDEVFRDEAFDLAGEPAGVVVGWKEGDRRNARGAFQDLPPGRLGSDADWADEPYACDDDGTPRLQGCFTLRVLL
jgi:hypothetical protein